MSYLALYRKYRPNTFDGLIGQEQVVKTLVNQIINDRLGHAYLFTGTRGTGKTSAAKIFAKAINCLNPKNGSPCGECECCKAISDPSNIDVIEIDAASNNGVNEIRELREKVQYPPVSCKYKVYIIDEVHMLTGPAFNALLKTLEEPPKHALFILATTEVHKIPATILSRCMRFDFKLISNEKIAQLISRIYDEQGKKYQKEAIFAIAKAGNGSIRDALSIADIAMSYSDNELTYNDVMDILGTSNTEILYSFILDVINGNTSAILNTIDKLSGLGKSMGVLIKDISMHLRDLLVVKNCKNANDLLGLPNDKFEILKNIASQTTEERLIRILEIYSQVESSLKYSTHPRIIFETASIKACKADADYNIDALMSRVKELELKLANTLITETMQIVENKQDTFEREVIKQPTNETEIIENADKNKKANLSDVPTSELKGKLLTNLRKIGSEMLWNVIQNVQLSVVGNILTFITNNSGDLAILDRSTSREIIEEVLEQYLPFELQVQLSENEKSLDELEQATDRMKKIFGDDIVIIK